MANAKLDEIDTKILIALNENCRSSVAELASKLKSTPDVITYRISGMQNKKIIVGYRADLNLAAISMTRFKSQLHIDIYDPKLEADFHKYCEQNLNIVYIVHQIGRCQLEVEIEVGDYYTYSRIVDEMHRTFPKFIRDIDTVLIRKETLKWVRTNN